MESEDFEGSAADFRTYATRATSREGMRGVVHRASTSTANKTSTLDDAVQPKRTEPRCQPEPEAALRPPQSSLASMHAGESQSTGPYDSYPLCNQCHRQGHHHRQVSPAELQRGDRSVVRGFSSPTVVPVVPPYSQASPQGSALSRAALPTKSSRPPILSGRVQATAGAMRQQPQMISPRRNENLRVPPTSLGKDDKLSRSFVVPWGNAPTLAASQIAQCRQQSEYDKGTPAGAQGRINWPFVLVTVTVTVSLVAVGLATSSTGFKSFLISDYTSPPKLAPWALPEFGPWTAPVNAVQPWYQVVNGDDSLYTDPRHRLVCVFHADSVGLVAPYAGVSFGLARFPFALCSAVVFCCPSLGANLEPGADYPETLAQEFLRRALKNRFPRPLLMLGNSSAGNWLQWNDLLTQAEAGNLSSTIGAWYEERLFDGVVLHWPDSALTRATWSKLPGALINLRAQLSTVRNMSLGVAIGQNVASGPHVASLASALGAASVYLLPPVLGATDYFGLTFSYYDESTLELLWRHVGTFLGQDVQSSVCYLLPADVFSFRVAQRHENASHLVLPSEDGRGVGPAGNATGVPGRMAYFEACRLVRDGFDVLHLEYGVVASRDGVWLSYTAPQQMKRFADALRDNLTAGCLGLWNPQWDDFAAACGGLEYPLARALFGHRNDNVP